MTNNIEITTQPNISELFEFTMTNNYKSIRGILSILFSLASAVGVILYWNQFTTWQRLLMLIFALTFTVIVPIEYYFRSKRQVKKNFAIPLIYTFSQNGIQIKQNDATASNEWSDIMKVITTKNLVVIYLSPVRAFILPTKNIGNQYDDLKKLMEEKTSCYKFKM